MDCLGTFFTHAQACDNVRVESATQWTAWAHSLHMPKPLDDFWQLFEWNCSTVKHVSMFESNADAQL